MKRVFIKSTTIALSLVMALALFSACGNSSQSATTEPAAATVAATVVTLEADGQKIIFQDTEGKTVQQLLELAEITLEDGDLVSVDLDQTFSGAITIRVLRKHVVTVVLNTGDPSKNVQHTAFIMGGTVADAIADAGIELNDTHSVNFPLDTALENGMEITISAEQEQAPEEEEEEEPEKPTTKPTTPRPTTPQPTQPPATEPTQPERYVVSVDTYYDCDGSGHGVKVITYSDGTQEEVYF